MGVSGEWEKRISRSDPCVVGKGESHGQGLEGCWAQAGGAAREGEAEGT